MTEKKCLEQNSLIVRCAFCDWTHTGAIREMLAAGKEHSELHAEPKGRP
jgi:hypothetical protein